MAVEVIKDSLVSLDPANSSTYEANADNFISELTDLDAQVKELIELYLSLHSGHEVMKRLF